MFWFNKLVDGPYTNITFIQCFFSAMIICFVGFELIVEIPSKSIDFVCKTVFLSIMLVQVYFYCWFGHKKIVKSTSLRDACYMTNWYTSHKSVRKIMFIFMERSKIPIELRAGGFFVLSLNTFMTILRTSYSYMAVLQRLYNS